jgi:hypothetical protein
LNGQNGDIKRAAHGYEPTRGAAVGAFKKDWRKEPLPHNEIPPYRVRRDFAEPEHAPLGLRAKNAQDIVAFRLATMSAARPNDD